MPNWAEGNIRLRGKRENILSFISNELVAIYEEQTYSEEEEDENGNPALMSSYRAYRPVTLEDNCGGEELIIRRDPDTNPWYYFKGSERQFLFKDDTAFTVTWSEGVNIKKDQILIMDDFNAGWNIDHEYFRKKAMEYKIDIRIFVWELGAQYTDRSTFYMNGDTDHETHHYSDWIWNSSMPYMGG